MKPQINYEIYAGFGHTDGCVSDLLEEQIKFQLGDRFWRNMEKKMSSILDDATTFSYIIERSLEK